jgi:uncharacterized cupredoxin-like copper-binding protein
LIQINAEVIGARSVATLDHRRLCRVIDDGEEKAKSMSNRTSTGRCGILAVLLVLGSLSMPAMPALADTTIKVDMWDKPDGSQGMDLSTAKVTPGKVTFEVVNVSNNDEEHEFLIAKTDLAPDQLPTTQDGARLDESKLPELEELGDLEPGESGKLTMDLTPGKYLLFCNEEGHFAAGMFAYLTVEP